MPRLNRVIAVAAAALALTGAASVPAMAAQRPTAPSTTAHQYYLSIGDSLSVGDQPNAKGVTLPTDQGYADQLYATLKKADSNLILAKVGCPGETSHTLNLGGICSYKGDARTSLTGHTGVQLVAALNFLRAHKGEVPLVTIDIGANDLNPCIALGSIAKIAACLPPVLAKMQKNLAYTLAKLRANDPHGTIVGMTYYVPELAEYLTGASGQQFAQLSIGLGEDLNGLIVDDFKAYKVATADVFTSFDTADFTTFVTLPPPIGKVPVDVARICQWTWECTPFHNEHANKAGYGVIAATFLATLKSIHYPV